MDNFYENEIKDYNINYDNAISDIDEIIEYIDNLYSTFSTAYGNDVEKIRSDLKQINVSLSGISATIKKKKDSTNEKAVNCDLVLEKAKNSSNTPTFKSNDYAYESNNDRKVFIENGQIIAKESFKKIPLSDYNGLFGVVAGIGKLFNSYENINSKVMADQELMVNGVLSWIATTK